MQDEVDFQLEAAEESMKDSVEHLGRELQKVRTGKASPAMFSDIIAEYYGAQTPIKQLANIGTSDSRTVVVQPFDKSAIQAIDRAIRNAGLGINPQNDGEVIRLVIPPLTEERRRDLTKRVKILGEDAKVSIRNARRDAVNSVRKMVKDGYPEDQGKRVEGAIQGLTDKYSNQVDEMTTAKEKEVMTV